MMLDRSELLPKLAEKIYTATKKFKDRNADGAEENADGESKFFEDGGLEYGNTDVFFGGLDGFLGPPNPNLDVTVLNEHTEEEDSKKQFVVPNYKGMPRVQAGDVLTELLITRIHFQMCVRVPEACQLTSVA